MTQCAAAPRREPRVLRQLGAFAGVAPPLRAPLGLVSRKPSCRDTLQPALGAVSPNGGRHCAQLKKAQRLARTETRSAFV